MSKRVNNRKGPKMRGRFKHATRPLVTGTLEDWKKPGAIPTHNAKVSIFQRIKSIFQRIKSIFQPRKIVRATP